MQTQHSALFSPLLPNPLRGADLPPLQHHLPHMNQRNSGTAGPSRRRFVGTSAAVVFLPALRFRRMLSSTIYPPSRPAMRHPHAPKQAVVIRAVGYLGFSFSRKMLLDTRPMRLARGTPTDVRTTRRPSCAILLLLEKKAC